MASAFVEFKFETGDMLGGSFFLLALMQKLQAGAHHVCCTEHSIDSPGLPACHSAQAPAVPGVPAETTVAVMVLSWCCLEEQMQVSRTQCIVCALLAAARGHSRMCEPGRAQASAKGSKLPLMSPTTSSHLAPPLGTAGHGGTCSLHFWELGAHNVNKPNESWQPVAQGYPSPSV